jgi:SAM-dependent methyltransferase
VKTFIEELPPGSLLADVGSGDGKYFGVNPNIVTIGCDRSEQLLQVSKEGDSSHETFACDAVALPLLTNAFDAVICIAVLHHLATVDRRYALISELVRISKDYGIVFIQAWALEQENDSKRVFTSQDTMVPWKLNKRFARPESSPAGSGQVTVEESQEPSTKKKNEDEVIIYERYCHVYREGELEDLCSRVPDCVVLESGYEKGNWFVKLQKVKDARLTDSSALRDEDQEFKVPTSNIRLCQEGKLKG